MVDDFDNLSLCCGSTRSNRTKQEAPVVEADVWSWLTSMGRHVLSVQLEVEVEVQVGGLCSARRLFASEYGVKPGWTDAYVSPSNPMMLGDWPPNIPCRKSRGFDQFGSIFPLVLFTNVESYYTLQSWILRDPAGALKRPSLASSIFFFFLN